MNLLFIISIFKDLVTEGGKKELLVSKMLIYIYIYIYSDVDFHVLVFSVQLKTIKLATESWESLAELSWLLSFQIQSKATLFLVKHNFLF